MAVYFCLHEAVNYILFLVVFVAVGVGGHCMNNKSVTEQGRYTQIIPGSTAACGPH